MPPPSSFPDCPVPAPPQTISLAHGGGGRLMRKLIEDVFMKAFKFENPALLEKHDSAVLDFPGAPGGGRLALTTDSYVVSPLFFPGGDIGRLAVCGAVNDLAAAGARPLGLTASFILEEGLAFDVLERVVASMQRAAVEAGVSIVSGDTKVVDRGKGDAIFITTAGAGVVPAGVAIGPGRVRAGDAILVTGDIGRHGVAILSVREGLAFETPIASDCAPLHGVAAALLGAGIDVHCMRDLTRGGLAAALNEIAEDGGVAIAVDEARVPVSEPVSGACEMLGLDPLYMACEGRMAVFVPEAQGERALAALRALPVAAGAARVGEVTAAGRPGSVLLRTRLGGSRALDLLSGDPLPRIC
jgi:hydrogenase expression/formation protein HypE